MCVYEVTERSKLINVLVTLNDLLIYRGDSITVQAGKVSASAWMDRKTVMVIQAVALSRGISVILLALKCHVQEASSLTTASWAELIVGISFEGTTGADRRAGSFTNTFFLSV